MMAANTTIGIANLIPDAQAVAESSKPKLESLLERIEAALCKYFGEDEETILNSLRAGFR